MEDIIWLRILLTYGPLGVFCAAAIYGMWKAANWLGANIIKPAFDEHVKLLQSIRSCNEMNTKAVVGIEHTLTTLSTKMCEGAEAQKEAASASVLASETIVRKSNGH